MAMITCPECGKQVSSLAASCPTCGNPIAKKTEYVMVKLEVADTPQTVTILDGEKVLWEGKSGQIAHVALSGPTQVRFKYQIGIMDAPKVCEGLLDAGISRKWLAKADNDRLIAKVTLIPVDSFDIFYIHKFEYKREKISVMDEKKMDKQIASWGRAGWELVDVCDYGGMGWTLFFKRPIVDIYPIAKSSKEK